MKRLLIIVCLVLAPLVILARAWGEDDSLHQNTQAAEKRVDQWDEEDHKIEKRESWEIPVVSALAVVGTVFYAAGRTAGFITCGVVASGLTVRFWPSGHHNL
jgi:hypothetical protein